VKAFTPRLARAFAGSAAALSALGLIACLGTGPSTVAPNPNPVIEALRDTTIDPGQTLAIPLFATDPRKDDVRFSLAGPDGAALTKNLFTWTPTRQQAGKHAVVFMARAAQQPERRDTAHLQITVRPYLGPVFRPQSDTLIEEGETLSLFLSSVNPLGNPVTYTVLGPAGSSFADNLFVWTPAYTEAGPHVVRFIARDALDPSRADTIFVTLNVRDYPVGQIPVLSNPGDRTLNAGAPFSLALSATDPLGLGIDYSVFGPPGVSVTGNVLQWTPALAQAGSHLVRLMAHDRGSVPRGDTAHVLFHVVVVNQAPVFAALRDTGIYERQALQVMLSSTDAEGDAVTYSLLSPPVGATVTGNVFRWTPDSTQAGTYALRFVVAQTGNQTGSGSGRDTAVMNLTVRDLQSVNLPGLVAYWDFNEGSGSFISDRTGGGRNATITGTPNWVAGIAGGTGLRFSGANTNYASSPSAFPDMTAQTISLWVYLDQIKQTCFIQESNFEAGRDNELSMEANGQVTYRTRDELTDIHGSKARLLTGRWYHLAATATPTTVRLYVNGALDTVKTGNFNLSGYHHQIQIGRKYDGRTNYGFNPNGVLDEIKLYNRALSASEIQQEYYRGVGIQID
jgi:hypothetical protein